MVTGARLEQTLKPMQQMILSPQMQQAIQILQMPLMELRAKVSEEMADNPLLEESLDINENIDDTLAKVNDDKPESSEDSEEKFQDQFERLTAMDDDWRDFFRQTSATNRFTAQDEEKRRYMENSISVSESLHEHLLSQLSLLALDLKPKKIAEFIIGSIDQNGYMQNTTEHVALSLNCPEEEVERILSKIQQFTPVGVCARNLKECLFLQINNTGESDPLMRTLIEDHLEDLARHKYPQIAKHLKVGPELIQEKAEMIAQLEPKPGRNFTQESVSYVIPEIYIEEKDGDFEVILNDDRIPHLRISNLYRSLMNRKDTQGETKEYIKNKVRSGMWLIKNIKQRQQTIFNIMREIVSIQKAFLRKGVGYLEPLTMQEIASRLNIHESTVSRAVSKKYVQTPQGLFPVKYFFSVEMKTEDGGSTSTRNIKQRIQDIVKAEDPKTPLSDQDIIILLAREGLKLARRTVAKYRKELKIPPSNLRKRY